MIDPDGAVFLLRSDNDEVGPHWNPPGGGIDPGETPEQGARRELREETGWHDLSPGPLLCTWEHDFTRMGVPVRQSEHIYVTRGPAAARSATSARPTPRTGSWTGAGGRPPSWPIRRPNRSGRRPSPNWSPPSGWLGPRDARESTRCTTATFPTRRTD